MACLHFARAEQASAAPRRLAFEDRLGPPVVIEGYSSPRWPLEERMKLHNVPGLGVAVIRRGRLAWGKGCGVKQAGTDDRVDAKTMFSVGSVSKVGSAVLTLRLVDAGKLDLDRDVNALLARWKVPANQYTAVRPVTLRGIRSHLAGFTVSALTATWSAQPRHSPIAIRQRAQY